MDRADVDTPFVPVAVFAWLATSVSLMPPPSSACPARTMRTDRPCTGFSGSVSYGQSKVKSDFASVTEQSGIRTGDGGFQVEVKGHTDLKGGAITSTQAAVDAGVNSFKSGSLSLSAIQNKADYKGSSYNVSVGFGKKEEGGQKEGGAPKPTDGSYQLTVVKPGGAPGCRHRM